MCRVEATHASLNKYDVFHTSASSSCEAPSVAESALQLPPIMTFNQVTAPHFSACLQPALSAPRDLCGESESHRDGVTLPSPRQPCVASPLQDDGGVGPGGAARAVHVDVEGVGAGREAVGPAVPGARRPHVHQVLRLAHQQGVSRRHSGRGWREGGHCNTSIITPVRHTRGQRLIIREGTATPASSPPFVTLVGKD